MNLGNSSSLNQNGLIDDIKDYKKNQKTNQY